MKNGIRTFLESRIIDLAKRFDYKISFSQNGEDIIIKIILMDVLKLHDVRYMDIGANDPRRFNNTYFLYRMFGKNKNNLLVEPNPDLCNKLREVRKNDIILQCGVVGELSKNETLTYWMMNDNTLNSFDKSSIDDNVKAGYTVKGTIDINIIDINSIFAKYGKFNFVSIDVEGLDIDIVKHIDYDNYAPECVCVENCNHNTLRSREDIMSEFLKQKGYIIYADTMVNTIYVKEDKLPK